MKILLAPLALAMAMNVSSSHAAYADLSAAALFTFPANPSTVSANYANLIGQATFVLSFTNLASFEWNFSDTERINSSYAVGNFLLDSGGPSSGLIPISLATGSSLGNADTTGWRTYTFDSPQTGRFTMSTGAESARLTTSLQLRNFLDTVPVLTPVPEPETYAMLLAGLGLMGVIARRKGSRKAHSRRAVVSMGA